MSNKLNIIYIKNVLGVNDLEDITKEKDFNIIDKTDFVDNEKSNHIEIFKIS